MDFAKWIESEATRLNKLAKKAAELRQLTDEVRELVKDMGRPTPHQPATLDEELFNEQAARQEQERSFINHDRDKE